MNASPSAPTGIARFSLTAIRLLALVATGISAYLTWVTLTHGIVAACGDASSSLACDDVLRSPWSRVQGIPVSLLGGLVYAGIFVFSGSLVGGPAKSTWKRTCCLALMGTALLSAIWFLSLQLLVIGHFCLFCLTIHMCGILLAVLLGGDYLLRQRSQAANAAPQLAIGTQSRKTQTSNQGSPRRTGFLGPAILSVAGVSLLAAIQLLFPSQTHEVLEADAMLANAPANLEPGAPSLESPTAGTPPTEPAVDNSLRPDAAEVETPTTEQPPATEPAEQPATQTSAQPAAPTTTTEQPIASQAAAQPPPKTSPQQASPGPPGRRAFLNGRMVLDLQHHGLLGSPEAPKVLIELVDYTCPDCRRLHQYLKDVRHAFGDRLAVVVFPIPLETDCNPYLRSTHHKHVGACDYAKLALAVFAVAPDKFATFHDWMMDPETAPPLDQATRFAQELVGVNHHLSQVESGKLKDYVRFFNVANVRRLPALVLGDKVMIGVPQSADAIIQAIDQYLPNEKSETNP